MSEKIDQIIETYLHRDLTKAYYSKDSLSNLNEEDKVSAKNKKYYLRSQTSNLVKNFESFAAVSNNPTENHSHVLTSNQTSLYNINASNQDSQPNIIQTDISLRNINTLGSNQNSMQNINTVNSNQNSMLIRFC